MPYDWFWGNNWFLTLNWFVDSEVVPKGRPSLSKTMRGYSLDDPSAPPSSEFCQPIAPQEKVTIDDQINQKNSNYIFVFVDSCSGLS